MKINSKIIEVGTIVFALLGITLLLVDFLIKIGVKIESPFILNNINPVLLLIIISSIFYRLVESFEGLGKWYVSIIVL